MDSSKKKFASFSAVLSVVSVFVVVVAVGNLIVRKQSLRKWKVARNEAQAKYKKAIEQQKTGMLAYSILNELKGWRAVTPVSQIIDFSTELPPHLYLTHLRMNRYLLLRPLPEEQASRLFRLCFFMKGRLNFTLHDDGTGRGKVAFPAFWDQLNADESLPYKLLPRIKDEAEGIEEDLNEWQLSHVLPSDPLWIPES